ncbi:MAG: hypothetical protein ABI224_16365 [Acetobacteraceae bacterium]
MGSHHDHRTQHDATDAPLMPTEAELRAVLAESDADMAAGRIIQGDVILREPHEAVARIDGRRATGQR